MSPAGQRPTRRISRRQGHRTPHHQESRALPRGRRRKSRLAAVDLVVRPLQGRSEWHRLLTRESRDCRWLLRIGRAAARSGQERLPLSLRRSRSPGLGRPMARPVRRDNRTSPVVAGPSGRRHGTPPGSTYASREGGLVLIATTVPLRCQRKPCQTGRGRR